MRGPSIFTTISSWPLFSSPPTSSVPPRTSASLAISVRLSITLSAVLGNVFASTHQLKVVRLLSISRPSIAALASRLSTCSPKPPAPPKASRKNLSLLADARALSLSSWNTRARISSSVSSVSSSSPLLSAPTGESRSWHSREQSRLAKSTGLTDMNFPWIDPGVCGRAESCAQGRARGRGRQRMTSATGANRPSTGPSATARQPRSAPPPAISHIAPSGAALAASRGEGRGSPVGCEW